jgi:hypothetical protein
MTVWHTICGTQFVATGCCCLQDFPYYFEDNVQHWLLWSTDKPLDRAAIEQQVAAKFPEQQWEHITFVNPAALQSVLAVSTPGSSCMNTAVCNCSRPHVQNVKLHRCSDIGGLVTKVATCLLPPARCLLLDCWLHAWHCHVLHV